MICKIKLLCAVFCFCAVALSAAEVKVPSFFKDWNEETHFDFTMDKARLNKNIVKLEKDPESEAGTVAVLRFPESGVDIQKCNKFIHNHNKITQRYYFSSVIKLDIKHSMIAQEN